MKMMKNTKERKRGKKKVEEKEKEEEGCFDVGDDGNDETISASDTQNPTAMVEDAITCLKMMHSEASMKLTISRSNFDGEQSAVYSPSTVEREVDTRCPPLKIW